MAKLNKSYIDGYDYPSYRQFWIDNYMKMQKDIAGVIWLYPFLFFEEEDITPEYLSENFDDLINTKGNYDFPIWNTTENQDKWLAKYCNIKSLQDSLLNRYSHDWVGFKKLKWVYKPKSKNRFRNKNVNK